MNQPTVKFSKEFITPNGTKEWVGTEWPVDVAVDKEAIFATLDKVRDAVLGWHALNNLDLGFGPGQRGPSEQELPVINIAHERLMRMMDDAATTEELNAYYPKVVEAKSINVSNFYFEKHEQLKK